MSQWYYAINKQPTGPVSPDDIKRLVAQGELNANTPVWKEGLQKWLKLEATELSQFISGPPPLADADPNHGRFDLNIGLPEKFQFDHNIEQGIGLSKSNMQAIGHVATKTNVMAFVALALAILGFFTGITFIPAIVCGHIALSQFRRDPSIGGEGLAKAALIMSYIVVGICALVIVAVILFSVVVLIIQAFAHSK